MSLRTHTVSVSTCGVPFDGLSLRAIVDELAPIVAGARIQHIVQPSATDLVLRCYRPGRTVKLLISCHPEWARMHLVEDAGPNPPAPPTFTMALRKWIEGAEIVRVAQRDADRIVDIEIHRYAQRFTLIAEFMGRHSNIILVAEDGTIVDSAKHVPPRLSRARQTLPGRPYTSPPRPSGLHIPWESSSREYLRPVLSRRDTELVSVLREALMGLSPYLARIIVRETAARGLDAAWEAIYGPVRTNQWSPGVVLTEQGDVLGAYPVTLEPDRSRSTPTFSEALEQAYGAMERDRELRIRSKDLADRVADIVAKLRRQIKDAQSWQDDLNEGERLQRWADLLLASAGDTIRVDNKVRVTDHYDGGEVEIPIAVGHSIHDTATGYYRKARKLAIRSGTKRERLPELEAELQALVPIQQQIERMESLEQLERIANTPIARSALRSTQSERKQVSARQAPAMPPGVRSITTDDGWVILVGSNAEGNDTLLRMCRPNDLWFHVRGGTSAHVAIRCGMHGRTPPPALIRFAAGFAAANSPSKHSRLVTVDYTLRKHVRRVKGGPPGRVRYSHERSIDIEPGSGPASYTATGSRDN